MNIYYVNFSEAAEKAVFLAANNEEGLMVAVSDNLWIATGKTAGTYSEKLQSELNIPVFHSEHVGGTCVVFPGDLSFCQLSKSYSDFGERAMEAIRCYLANIGLIVQMQGNDLMLYSPEDKQLYKVASYGSGWIHDKYMQTVVHVSIGMDEELVSKLCTKHCQKKPRGLNRYGVTAQDVCNAMSSIIDASS